VSFRDRIPILAAALWWGSLSTIGLLVVPLLFANMATAAEAGRMAARLFQAQTWVSLACGLLLLMCARKPGSPARLDWADGCVAFVLSGLLLALLAEFAIAPRILARQNLKLWHGIGSAMYLLQWLCAAVVLWKVADQARDADFRSDGPS
jgi:Domain of unknown function (DUF4149)